MQGAIAWLSPSSVMIATQHAQIALAARWLPSPSPLSRQRSRAAVTKFKSSIARARRADRARSQRLRGQHRQAAASRCHRRPLRHAGFPADAGAADTARAREGRHLRRLHQLQDRAPAGLHHQPASSWAFRLSADGISSPGRFPALSTATVSARPWKWSCREPVRRSAVLVKVLLPIAIQLTDE